MSLLQELLAEGKRQVALPARGKKLGRVDDARENSTIARNFAAKNSQGKSGAGAHEPKNGKKASRSRQKKAWKADIL